jgi:hypothetical protein
MDILRFQAAVEAPRLVEVTQVVIHHLHQEIQVAILLFQVVIQVHIHHQHRVIRVVTHLIREEIRVATRQALPATPVAILLTGFLVVLLVAAL